MNPIKIAFLAYIVTPRPSISFSLKDCSVVGLGDSQSEERVAAVVVLNPNKKTTMEDLLKWCNDNMEEAEVKSMVITVQIAPMLTMWPGNFSKNCSISNSRRCPLCSSLLGRL